MKTIVFFLVVFGVAVVTVVTCAPSDGRAKFVAIACSQLCPDVNHPVCAVDAQGLPKTFANRCFVDFAYCREGKCSWLQTTKKTIIDIKYEGSVTVITFKTAASSVLFLVFRLIKKSFGKF